MLEGEEDVQVPWLFLFSSRLKRTEEEEGVPGLGLRKKNKMGLSGEPGPRGKWKERKKKNRSGHGPNRLRTITK